MKLHIKANVRNAAKSKKDPIGDLVPELFEVQMLQNWRLELKKAIVKICGKESIESGWEDGSSTHYTIVVVNTTKLSVSQFEDAIRSKLGNSSDDDPADSMGGGGYQGWMKVAPTSWAILEGEEEPLVGSGYVEMNMDMLVKFCGGKEAILEKFKGMKARKVENWLYDKATELENSLFDKGYDEVGNLGSNDILDWCSNYF